MGQACQTRLRNDSNNTIRNALTMRDGWDYVAVCDVRLLNESEAAGLFLIEGEEIWLPWSQIDTQSVDYDGDVSDLYVRRWLAEERDLPYTN